LSATEKHHPGNPRIDDALVINIRLLEVERQQTEEKRRDAAYKKRQLWFNGLLVAFTAASG
jgi:hypothetical protein